FLGDVRSYPLLAAFHASVELAHAADDLPRAELRERIARRIDQEQELCVAPSLFEALAAELGLAGRVEARLKRGTHPNELTRFRYDVVIHAGCQAPQEPPAVRWPAEGLSLMTLREQLCHERPEKLAIAGVPNARVAADVQAWESICDDSGPLTAGQLRSQLASLPPSAAVDPEALWALAEESGYQAHIRWSEADEQGALDVVFERRDLLAQRPTAEPVNSVDQARRRHAVWSRYTTDPVRGLLSQRLVPALRQRVESSLPAAWMPAAFVLLEQMPLTTGGKLDRRALPEPTGCRPDWSGPLVAPRSELEARLVGIWETLLDVRPVGVHDSFFDLGGHSMLAVKMVAEIQQSCGRSLPLNVLFQRPTVAELAELLERPATSDADSSLVPIQTAGQRAPLFLIHPAGGTVFCYRELCQALGSEQPVYGLQAQGLDGRHAPLTRIEDMAAHYIQTIRQVQPAGPYQLCGWSLGGNIAYEMACQLQDQGDEVSLLALVDAGAQAPDRQPGEADFLAMLVGLFPDQQQLPLENLRQLTVAQQLDYFVERAGQAQLIGADVDLRSSARPVFEVFQANVQAIAGYQPRRYAGPVTLLKAAQQAVELPSDDILGWRWYLTGSIDVHVIPGNHVHMLIEPNVQRVASVLARCLQAARHSPLP
ncbi:MAG TPA: thioesterase domain-containing protein, partial [Pirellulales bacterium]|nr:thioesterase domain-containing protein [Pirellulales bacterium]